MEFYEYVLIKTEKGRFDRNFAMSKDVADHLAVCPFTIFG